MNGASLQSNALSADDPIAIEGLSVEYPNGARVLRDVSLRVKHGEVLGLVGESGSGKSLLGLTLLGLADPEARITGEARLHGIDMVAADPEQRRIARRNHAGAVFQDPMTSLNPTMKVEHQLAEVTKRRSESIELLRRAGIPDPERRLRQYPHELSGGLRQRVMVAMALARNPSVLLLDEPTTALDVTIQGEILALFQELTQASRAATIFITHDLAVARTVADRIAVLYAGQVLELGPAAGVFESPAHPYTAGLLACRAALDRHDAVLTALAGETPDSRRLPPGCVFAPRCQHAEERCVEAIPSLASSPTHGGEDACIRAAELAAAPQSLESAAELTSQVLPFRQSSADCVLRLNQLVKHFGRGDQRRTAVAGVSLDIPRGGSVALVGESGSGKTTVLRMAVGLEKPDSGTVDHMGNLPPQLVFQDAGASLTPWLPVGQLLRERLRSVGERERVDERIAETLAMVGLSPTIASRRPSELSGGQRQRVAIARAVVAPPAVLACDEPTSALDAPLVVTVVNLLRTLRSGLDLALLFVTHDLFVAQAVADRVAVMCDGEIVEEGPAEQVVGAPEHPFTRKLVAATPLLREAV